MNNEIKFRFIFKTVDGRIFSEPFTLQQLMDGRYAEYTSGWNNVTLIRVCRFANFSDDAGNEVYEGDILKWSRINWQLDGHPKRGGQGNGNAASF
jgi:hypothetical protein